MLYIYIICYILYIMYSILYIMYSIYVYIRVYVYIIYYKSYIIYYVLDIIDYISYTYSGTSELANTCHDCFLIMSTFPAFLSLVVSNLEENNVNWHDHPRH